MKQDIKPTPEIAYKRQKAGAERRVDVNSDPIKFKLTFEEWWDIWEKSGKWDMRGRGADAYCMARHGDVGHYEVGNVSIITQSENHKFKNAYLRSIGKLAGWKKGRPKSKESLIKYSNTRTGTKWSDAAYIARGWTPPSREV